MPFAADRLRLQDSVLRVIQPFSSTSDVLCTIVPERSADGRVSQRCHGVRPSHLQAGEPEKVFDSP